MDRESPTLPIVVSDSQGDLDIFDTVEEAEQYVEPPDVKARELTGYDAIGRRLVFTVVEIEHKFLRLSPGTIEVVRISLADPLVDARSELREKLMEFITRRGKAMSVTESATTEELIRLARE